MLVATAERLSRWARAFRYELGLNDDTKRDRRRLYKIYDEYRDIAHQFRVVGAEPGQAFSKAIYIHLNNVLNTAVDIIGDTTGLSVSAAIKLLWKLEKNDQPVIHTFLRSSETRELREADDPPDFYPYKDNSVFQTLVEAGLPVPYFASCDLRVLERQGIYRNTHKGWAGHYTAIAVAALPYSLKVPNDLIGFICIDSKDEAEASRAIEGNHVRTSLLFLSRHLYNVLGEIVAVPDRDRWSPHKYLGALLGTVNLPFRFRNIGWTFRNDKVVPLDEIEQRQFQTALEAVNQHAATRRRGLSPQRVFEERPPRARKMERKVQNTEEQIAPQAVSQVEFDEAAAHADQVFKKLLPKLSAAHPEGGVVAINLASDNYVFASSRNEILGAYRSKFGSSRGFIKELPGAT